MSGSLCQARLHTAHQTQCPAERTAGTPARPGATAGTRGQGSADPRRHCHGGHGRIGALRPARPLLTGAVAGARGPRHGPGAGAQAGRPPPSAPLAMGPADLRAQQRWRPGFTVEVTLRAGWSVRSPGRHPAEETLKLGRAHVPEPQSPARTHGAPRSGSAEPGPGGAGTGEGQNPADRHSHVGAACLALHAGVC